MPEVPAYLIEQVREGKVVLLLGAGASYEATNSKGSHPPRGNELAELLANKFLGGRYSDRPLDQVSEMAISESDLVTVQDFIYDIFECLEPSEAHNLLPTFAWEGMATTNYDRLIEVAYERHKHPVQIPQPFVKDGEQILDRMRDPNSLKLLKLHGCITRTNDPDCPLILTVDQYIQHKKGRNRLFSQLYDWAFERPLVFIGHSLGDLDLRQLLNDVISEAKENRPRYYAVIPDPDPIQVRFWENSKKVTCINATFLDFMTYLDNSIQSPFRKIKFDYSSYTHPIAERFVSNARALSERCKAFLEVDAEYVKTNSHPAIDDPRPFYRGVDLGWAAIEQKLDIRRDICDEILSDVFLDEASHQNRDFIIVSITGHAGSGKSVLLKRIAWDAAQDYDRLCIHMRPHGVIDWTSIQELAEACQERIYLFVDNAADHAQELIQLSHRRAGEGGRFTVVIAERTNEWNMVGEDVRNLISAAYNLKYLAKREISDLLSLLRSHRALGTLEGCTEEECYQAFKVQAGRQLLVALHEATLGKPFEEIVVDEYRNISPVEARAMYMSICVLNRLNVDVRAGIISRVHGIRFEDFQKQFFAPLENIVRARHDPIIRDIVYSCRHPHIADIVFINALPTQEERFDPYIRCLKSLNIDYSSDRRAFQQMVRARGLMDLFENPALIEIVFREAQAISVGDQYVLQQKAIFEMRRSGGNIHQSIDLLNQAQSIAPHSKVIKHSLAEAKLVAADRAHTDQQRERFLNESELLAISLIGRRTDESYPFHTLCKISLKRLEYSLFDDPETFSPTKIEESVRKTEKYLQEGLQRFPGDPFLLESESQLAELMSDSVRALSALERAFAANNRNGWFAIRLSRIYMQRNEIEKAGEILKKGIEANNSDHDLHFAYAKHLLQTGSHDSNEMIYHLRRSFSPGDENYEAQLLYGRELYLSGEIELSKKVFTALDHVRIDPKIAVRIQYPLDRCHVGTIVKQETTYCFIQRDGMADWIFLHESNTNEGIWEELRLRRRVKFRVGFTFRGASAFDVGLL